jgi:transmembrane sensor
MKLSDAATVLNRYPGPELVVRDPRVANLRVSGMFKLGDAERFGRTLEQIYPVRVEHKGGQVEIVPSG